MNIFGSFGRWYGVATIVVVVMAGFYLFGALQDKRGKATREQHGGSIFPTERVSQSPPVSPTQQPTPSVAAAQTDPTARWKVHIDTTFGFSIRYPYSWTVYTNPTRGLGYSFHSPDLQIGDGGVVETGSYVRVVTWTKGQDTITRNFPNISLQDWFSQDSKDAHTVTFLSKPADTRIAGHPAILVDVDIASWGKAHRAIVSSKSKFFQFDYFYEDKEQETTKDTFQRMLSTLKILP